MDDTPENKWLPLGNSKYMVDIIFQMQKDFKKLDLPNMLITIANNGGPISITSNKKLIITDYSIQNVIFFNNKGSIICKYQIKNLKQPIAGYEFIQQQQLLVVCQTGKYFVYDPFNQQQHEFDLGNKFRQQNIMQVKTFDLGFVFLTQYYRFYYVKNVFESISLQLKCQLLKQPPIHWIVTSPKYTLSQKIEVQICHPIAGIIVLIEEQNQKLYYNHHKNQEHFIDKSLPHIKQIKFICPSWHKLKLIAYFCAIAKYKEVVRQEKSKKQKIEKSQKILEGYDYRIYILSNDFQSTNKVELNVNRLLQGNNPLQMNIPKDILWCGDQALAILNKQNQILLINLNNQHVYIKDNEQEMQNFKICKQQIDGIRIISKKYQKYIRKCPPPYIRIFQPVSQYPSSLLYYAYQAFYKRQPFQDDQIRNHKSELAQAVIDCIKAGQFQINNAYCSKLIKAASYGKSFLEAFQIKNNQLQEVCKNLRVLNAIRQVIPYRICSYYMFQNWNDQMLLKLLLRYNHHYLAYQIYNYLKKTNKFKIQIYTHWACCVVAKHQGDQDQICKIIKQKLQTQKGVSFIEIAHKAKQKGKTSLVLRLLQYQPSVSKKIPLLLSMGVQFIHQEMGYNFLEKAYEVALISKDFNLINLVIQKLHNFSNESFLFQLFSRYYFTKIYLINYLKIFDRKLLVKFMYFNKMFQEVGIISLSSIKTINQSQVKLEILNNVLQYFKSDKKDWKKNALQYQIKNLTDFLLMKSNPDKDKKQKSKINKVFTINNLAILSLQKGEQKTFQTIKKLYHFNDIRVFATKMAYFTKHKKYEQIQETFQKAKKTKFPIQIVGDIIKGYGSQNWAKRIMTLACRKDKQTYQILRRVNWTKKAIEIAIENKDYDILDQFQPKIYDPQLKKWLQQKKSKITKK